MPASAQAVVNLAQAETTKNLTASELGMYLGFLTESNKPFIRFGVTGPI